MENNDFWDAGLPTSMPFPCQTGPITELKIEPKWCPKFNEQKGPKNYEILEPKMTPKLSKKVSKNWSENKFQPEADPGNSKIPPRSIFTRKNRKGKFFPDAAPICMELLLKPMVLATFWSVK